MTSSNFEKNEFHFKYLLEGRSEIIFEPTTNPLWPWRHWWTIPNKPFCHFTQNAVGTSCSVEDDLTPQTSLEIVTPSLKRTSTTSLPIRSKSEPDYEAQNDSDSAIMLEDNNFTEVWIRDLEWTLVKVARWLFSCHFRPLLTWAAIFEVAGSFPKIGLSLKPNHHCLLKSPIRTVCAGLQHHVT